MDARQHAELKAMLLNFKEEYLSGIAKAFSDTQKDLEDSEAAVKTRFHDRFARIEDMLNGPYDKLLEWDWVPSPPSSLAISQVLTLKKLRLRDMPEFEITAREYFLKYARSGEEVVTGLGELGFYLPPRTKLFEQFFGDVIEGRKLLLHHSVVKRLYIPPDQLDLALLKAQPLLQSHSTLPHYLPPGLPDCPADKHYFLDIANSLCGLHFKVIHPLSEAELRMSAALRRTVGTACEGLVRAQTAALEVGGLRPVLENVRSPDMFGVSGFLDLYARYYAKVHGIAEEPGETTLDFFC